MVKEFDELVRQARSDRVVRELAALRLMGQTWPDLIVAAAEAEGGNRSEPIHRMFADLAEATTQEWVSAVVAIAEARMAEWRTGGRLSVM